MSTSEPEVVVTLDLTEREIHMAQISVRKYLQKLRNNYSNDLRRAGRRHFADTHLRKFDEYLDLYERLGGNPDDIKDPEER